MLFLPRQNRPIGLHNLDPQAVKASSVSIEWKLMWCRAGEHCLGLTGARGPRTPSGSGMWA